MQASLNTESQSSAVAYGFHCAINDKDFAAAVVRVTEALKTEGFGILTEIDVEAEPDIGLLLPCNVVVREMADDSLVVGFMDPVAVLQMTSNPEVAKVAHEVHERLQRVKALLTAPVTTAN